MVERVIPMSPRLAVAAGGGKVFRNKIWEEAQPAKELKRVNKALRNRHTSFHSCIQKFYSFIFGYIKALLFANCLVADCFPYTKALRLVCQYSEHRIVCLPTLWSLL